MFNYCNTIRNGRDVQDSWDAVTSIIENFAKNQVVFKNVSGPGRYNDPDQVRNLFLQQKLFFFYFYITDMEWKGWFISL